MTIPSQYHFIFGLSPDFGGKPFSLIHYLAIASCHAINKPASINFYYAYEPSGIWWDRAKPYLNLVRVGSPNSVYGRDVAHVAHKADVLRLMILLEHGGIYLDMDVLCLRPFAPLQKYDVVMGREYGVGLCNAVIMAKPGAEFIQRWLSEYRTFSKEEWNFHSVRLPATLAAQAPHLIHVLDHKSFFWPMHWREHLIKFFVRPDSDFCKTSFCVHLWETLTWQHVGCLTPSQLWSDESEFSRIARQYIDPTWSHQAA